jgi:hypothetical protein
MSDANHWTVPFGGNVCSGYEGIQTLGVSAKDAIKSSLFIFFEWYKKCVVTIPIAIKKTITTQPKKLFSLDEPLSDCFFAKASGSVDLETRSEAPHFVHTKRFLSSVE